MGKLYFATDRKGYVEMLTNKQIPLTKLDTHTVGLIFTEDKKYWVTKIQSQEEKDILEDYIYTNLVEFEIDASFINSLMENSEIGRFSDKIYEYYKMLNKRSEVKKITPNETNVLCILDVYESDETPDKIAQLWSIKVDSKNSKLWVDFCENVQKIRAIGGIVEKQSK
jgi:hypothetical protein